MLDIEVAVQQKFPKFEHKKPWIKKPTIGLLRRVTHEEEINRFLAKHQGKKGFEFIDEVLDYFNFSYLISHRERTYIPATGRVIIVANHPLGALDGLSLLKLVGEVRRDVKILANDMLMHFTGLSDLLLPVDNMSGMTKRKQVDRMIACLNREEAIIIFPAGEVSRLRPNGIQDGKWATGFLNLARRTGAPILPVYIDARNSSLFYGCSMVYKPLATMMLAHEVFNQHSKRITFRVGEMIPYHAIARLPLCKKETVKLLRRHVYRIGKGKAPLFKTEKTIIHPPERRDIKKELQHSQIIGETRDGMIIYLFDYFPESVVMQELGRLREMTFRQIGEGTGKKCDLDQYDRYYRHLILWDENELEIAGAYRLAEVENVRNVAGHPLYSEELFEYDEAKVGPYFRQAIELGRSFVNPKYWGKRSLDYLWYGIGAYLKQHPHIRYLLGPVSLSDSYPEFAKALITQFYQHYFYDSEQLATAKMPYRVGDELSKQVNMIISGLDKDSDFKAMRHQLQFMNVSIPTLYKQYSELCTPDGIRFIDFNIDPQFSDCIDALVMLDLDKLKSAKRTRYLGEAEN